MRRLPMAKPSPIHDVESLVHAEIHRALAQHDGVRAALTGDAQLTAGLGLTSMQVAGIAARLAVVVGADPFARSMALTDVRTVGDLCRAFAAAASGALGGPGSPDELAAARRRAEARRARLIR